MRKLHRWVATPLLNVRTEVHGRGDEISSGASGCTPDHSITVATCCGKLFKICGQCKAHESVLLPLQKSLRQLPTEQVFIGLAVGVASGASHPLKASQRGKRQCIHNRQREICPQKLAASIR